jgi:hypothetical protein
MRRGSVFLIIALVLFASDGNAASRGLQHVTLIGDSGAGGIPGYSAAIAILSQGIDLDLQIAACRRIDTESCPIDGVSPSNVVQLVNTMGSKLGPNVVVAVGYNDPVDEYAQSIENALSALETAGVKHVYWLTLRASQHGYVNMNEDIVAAAAKHPELSVIDWNVYSRSHSDWFQPDGLHPLAPGTLAMVTLIHKRLLDDGIAIKPVRLTTSTLPVAHHGKAYTAKVAAADGVAPYRWSLLTHAPKGLRLLANGTIIGTPLVEPGTYLLNVLVKDAAGATDRRRIALHVTP